MIARRSRAAERGRGERDKAIDVWVRRSWVSIVTEGDIAGDMSHLLHLLHLTHLTNLMHLMLRWRIDAI